MSWMRITIRGVAMGILFIAACSMAAPVALRLATDRYVYDSVADLPHADVAIVPGASVAHGEPSPILEQRASAAVELFDNKKVDAILVTGDNGALNHDEVTPVRKYLIDAGIPAGRIFLDHAGFDTYSSMYRARDIFQAHSAIIVTQDFHMPRALFLARMLGLDADGYEPAGSGGSGYDYLREIPASVKALFDLALHRVPKYLGPAIPLSGDGSTTWY